MNSLQIGTSASLQIHILAHLLNVQNWTRLHRACVVETVLIKISKFIKGHLFQCYVFKTHSSAGILSVHKLHDVALFFPKRTSTNNSHLCYENQGDIHSKTVTNSQDPIIINSLCFVFKGVSPSPSYPRHCCSCILLLYEQACCY